MKILLTNWINFLGVFIATFVFSVVSLLLSGHFSYSLLQAICAVLFEIVGYGMIFWLLLIAALVVLDLLLIVFNYKYLRTKLIIEWMIISSPFAYWTIEYHQWIFAVGVSAFFITQLVRQEFITRIIVNATKITQAIKYSE